MSLDFYASVNQYKSKLLVTGYKDGKRVLEQIAYEPYLFVPAKDGEYRTIHGNRADILTFDNIYEAREYSQKYANVHGIEILGSSNWANVYIYDNFLKKNKQWNRDDIHVVPLDIETDVVGGFPDIATADRMITAITISRHGKKAVFGLKPYDTNGDPNVKYYKCIDEATLLRTFLEVWNSPFYSPDVITGWNIDGFDIPYLVARITRILGKEWANKLSPWGIVNAREIETAFGKAITMYTLVGIASLDYLQLYRKFITPIKGQQESYRLDYIGMVEVQERKLDYSEYGDLGELYIKNPQLYIEYNIRDVDLIDKLDSKLNLIDLALTMAYDAGVNYQDVFGTVKPWDCRIHNFLRQRNIVIPFAKISDTDWKIEGGYVKDVQAGLHRWVVSEDLASSYPHQIIQYNIGPDTFVDKVPGVSVQKILDGEVDIDRLTENGKYTLTPNGCRFRRDKQSFLSSLMEHYFNLRKVYKGQMLDASRALQKETDTAKRRVLEFEIAKYDNLQHSTKISINGLYGSLANMYNRWFDPNFAEAITMSGQLAIRWAERTINEYMNKVVSTTDVDYVIAIDTDSLYITLERMIDKMFKDQSDTKKIIGVMDKICQDKLAPVLEKSYADLAKYMHAYGQKMQMKRECLANKGIWTGKKHYILNVYDKEGVAYDPPDRKIVGIEAVRSSTPNAARQKIKEAIDIILNKEESDLQAFVKSVREDFNTLPIDDIAFPRGANDMEKWQDKSTIYKKSTPIAVKGSLLHNNLLKELNITRVKAIQSGEKIKFVYIKKYNPYNIEVMAFNDVLPEELGLHEHIDRYKQFENGFLKPLINITNSIGWYPEKIATLDAFFV